LKFSTVLEVVKVHVYTEFHQAIVQRFISYQQCTRFEATLDFYREYLWDGSTNQQPENGVINCAFFTFGESNLVNYGPLAKK